MNKILITGGTGLIGTHLVRKIAEEGLQPAILSRKPDPARGILGYSAGSLQGASAIINLAGENLSARRWTPRQKSLLLNSRIDTLRSIHQMLREGNHAVRTLISASAIGYYGSLTSARVFHEDDPPGSGFLADVCRAWEEEARSFESLGIRVVLVRIGIVMSPDGGTLKKLLIPLRFGFSVPLGSGNQWIPWIDMNDLTGAIHFLLTHDELSGPFNIVAPNPLTNREIMKTLAQRHHRVFLPVGVPALFLKLALGEMAVVTLEGSRISSRKLTDSGFVFTCPEFRG